MTNSRLLPLLATMLALALLPACGTTKLIKDLFAPKKTPEEKNALAFNVQGIQLGSPPSNLTLFSQVKKDPKKRNGMDLYEVFNPNPHISQLLAWYLGKELRQMELRYFKGGGVQTLEISGGWEGIRDAMINDFGPPSRFGRNVPVVATMAGIDPAQAVFNGEWIFSRINRQLNYIAFDNQQTGDSIAIVTIIDTTPETKKQKKKTEPFPDAQPAPPASESGPGFSVQPPKKP